MSDNERGYTFCWDQRGKPCRGKQVTGGSHNVAIPIGCPPGAQPAALFHTHPGGDINMSVRDINTMHEKKLPVCIKAQGRIKCYRPKKS